LINGFVVIDKPAGITSHDVVSRVRRIFGTRKAGHTGTLDPFATGVLPVAVNGGTKVIPFLDEGVKCYEALMQLGVETDTLDMTGAVLMERDFSFISKQQLLEVFGQFTGSIFQIPPMYSAIKQGGQPLYKLARMGQNVERSARPAEIHSIKLLSFNLPFVSIRVTCSRGTYIRTLADDIGAVIGCGAALKELRRTASGSFSIENAVTLDQLEKMAGEQRIEEITVTPMVVLNHLLEIPLTPEGMEGLRCGRSPSWEATIPGIPVVTAAETLVRLTSDGKLAAVAALVPAPGSVASIVLKRVLI